MPALGRHNDGVAELVLDVCDELGLDRGDGAVASRAAELHDVGKLAIPDSILNEPGALDEHEWEFMRRHTIVGERIIASATSLATWPRSSALRTNAGTGTATPTG